MRFAVVKEAVLTLYVLLVNQHGIVLQDLLGLGRFDPVRAHLAEIIPIPLERHTPLYMQCICSDKGEARRGEARRGGKGRPGLDDYFFTDEWCDGDRVR